MKREAIDAQKTSGKFVPPADPLLKGCPFVAEAVADLFWEDGSPREPYGLSFNWSTGQCLAQLNDRAGRRSLSTTATTAAEGVAQLEELLATPGNRPWRHWGGVKKGR
jgi:hypothetical protein